MIARILLFLLFIFPSASLFAQELLDDGTRLPLFIIDTNGQGIPDEPKIEAHLGIIHKENSVNYLTDNPNVYNGRIGVEIRGNGTRTLDKVSYLFETQKENGENNNVSLLGFPEENDWVLYGPYIDRTFLRNVLTYNLARDMGYYASRVQFCELVINSEYLGVYVLMEKIKRDKNRVDITKFDESETQEEGGYLFKIDSWWNSTIGWLSNSFMLDGQERKWNYHYLYPKADEISDVQKKYLEETIDNLDLKMSHLQDFSDQSVYDLIDIENFVDYFIINEFAFNPDAYRLSTYLYFDTNQDNGQIKVGPAWDYNFGYGNYWDRENKYGGWEYDNNWWEYPNQVPIWWTALKNDSQFNELLKTRWATRRESLITCNAFTNQIDAWIPVLEEPASRNFKRWPILAEANITEWSAGTTYLSEVEYLKDFICQRIEWLDNELGYNDGDTGLSLKDNFTLFPNPASNLISIESKETLQTVPHTIQIVSPTGVIIKDLTFTPGQNENLISWTIEEITAGLYFVLLDNKDFRLNWKIIIAE